MPLGGTDAGGISASNCGMILIVEDDDRISRLERFVLEQVGYRVTWAGTGEDALEILPKATPSVVLLDVRLPQMAGFTTCQKIRESSPVPIIMVTAMDQDVDRVRGSEMGADDCITKPFSTHELASRVKSVLRRIDGSRPTFLQSTNLQYPKPEMAFLHARDKELATLPRRHYWRLELPQIAIPATNCPPPPSITRPLIPPTPVKIITRGQCGWSPKPLGLLKN